MTLVGIAAAAFFFYYENFPPAFGYEITSAVKVGDEGKGGFDDLKFSYKDTIITEGSIVALKFENNTRKPIRSEDYESPIEIVFENATVIAARLKDAIPKSLEPEITYKSSSLFISPTLINDGDIFNIETLVSEKYDNIYVKSRIAGISEIRKIETQSKTFNIILALTLMAFALFACLAQEALQLSMHRHKNHVAIYMTLIPYLACNVLLALFYVITSFFCYFLLKPKGSLNIFFVIIIVGFILCQILARFTYRRATVFYSESKEDGNYSHGFEVVIKDKKQQ